MRFTQAFIPTVKEVPKDAVDASHVLLLRAGYIRMVGSGIYELLPLARRALHKISAIIREAMDEAGAQEVLMPAILPASYFQETGRWDVYGPVLLRLKDRKGGDYHLGPTHEEIITDLVRREVKSYRQLPLNLYQVQMKYRDEPRPRAGLMRCREFLMKDAYSFDADEEGALRSYGVMREAYHRIFRRLGLDYRIVEADSGAIGGSQSAEFQILAQSGEDRIVVCGNCNYAANVEAAEAQAPAEAAPDASAFTERELVETPGTKTMDAVVAFFEGRGVTHADTIKALVYAAGDETPELVMALVRGDREVNEIALARHLGVDEVRLATDEEAGKALRAKVGYLGPVFDAEKYPEGAPLRLVADPEVATLASAVCGANQTGHHYAGVAYGRDFEAELAPIREVGDGDPCPVCGSVLATYRGIEGGHIFVLGTHYSGKMNATFLDAEGQAKPLVMGCYGIGVTRLLAAAIEQHHDDDGIAWPMPIAPYQAIVLPLGKDEAVAEAAAGIYAALRERGVEVLLDDRAERPGVKFKVADLIGIPLRVAIGGRGLKEGVAELKGRTEDASENIPLDQIADAVVARIEAEGGLLRPRRAEG